ncbi:MAG: protoheme IX farnesyltransferase [Bacteroidales bacterium]
MAVCIGVMLVAAGSSVFNQVQEAVPDKIMERTRRRPIPAGTISKTQAIVFAIIISLSGVLILWFLASPVSSLLAIITLAGYNLIYTPLKSITFFALIPGAMVGALPPAIGWAAGGGSLGHSLIILVGFFFFMGQIPHFWLILLRHEKDYLRAGFPALTSFFNQKQISRLTMTWILALMAAAIFLPFFGVIQSKAITTVVVTLTLLLVSVFVHDLTGSKPLKTYRAFIILNSYFLFMMLILIADSLLR